MPAPPTPWAERGCGVGHGRADSATLEDRLNRSLTGGWVRLSPMSVQGENLLGCILYRTRPDREDRERAADEIPGAGGGHPGSQGNMLRLVQIAGWTGLGLSFAEFGQRTRHWPRRNGWASTHLPPPFYGRGIVSPAGFHRSGVHYNPRYIVVFDYAMI